MTPEQKRLVQTTWEMVVPLADQAAILFYDRLFTLDPELRPLFARGDMAEQRKKLMQMITVAVRGLDRIGELMPAVEALGRRHAPRSSGRSSRGWARPSRPRCARRGR